MANVAVFRDTAGRWAVYGSSISFDTRAEAEAFANPSREIHAAKALVLLRKAMVELKAAGATRACDKLRLTIKSADGAVRAARMRDNRLGGN